MFSSGRQIAAAFKLAQLGLTRRHAYNVIRGVRKEKLTYLESAALLDLYESARAIEEKRLPGIFIEAGCALGGSALVIASAKTPARPLYIYDTFEMIPPPSASDGADAHNRYQQIASGQAQGIDGEKYYGYRPNLMEQVAQSFAAHGLPTAPNQVELVKGRFQDTLQVKGPVAFAHLDCDWYDSVMVCLEQIVPALAPGGRIILDDYQAWSGCRKAVDTYFAGRQNEFEWATKSRLHITRR